jgi:hypothetical protein
VELRAWKKVEESELLKDQEKLNATSSKALQSVSCREDWLGVWSFS